ncbi:MAG: hypothetical protein LBC74_14390, partial [Planctomycetaceae bacterium]|nr:hypothetical protein [Planctomycetaceae bacterium]
KGLLSKLIDKESPFRCSNKLAANKLATIKTTKRLFQGQLSIDTLPVVRNEISTHNTAAFFEYV